MPTNASPFLSWRLSRSLAAGLLFLLPGGPLHAQEAMTELEYAENGTDPVVTFTAVDPEGRTSTGRCCHPLPRQCPS